MNAATLDRREFLSALGGGLLLAIGGIAPAGAAQAPPVGGWLRIGPDGSVTLATNTSEIGQGTNTALAQIIADELDLEWRAIRVEMAPVETAYYNPRWQDYATYGSGGIRGNYTLLRETGARARAMLVAAAAERFKVAAADCRTEMGAVIHDASGQRASYAELAEAAARLPVPERVTPKPKSAWRYIGQPLARLDVPAKVDGSARFGMDATVPGLLFAAICQAPRFGATLAGIDTAAASPGVRVVRLGNAVAVVARDYWTAQTALERLKPRWDLARASGVSSPAYGAQLAEATRAGGRTYAPRGTSAADAEAAYRAAGGGAKRSLSALYEVPFLAHAPMEPMNATARVTADAAELWLPTQVQSATQAAVARLLGLAPDKVTIHTLLSGGGFGRRGEFDFALQAAEIARAVDAPVKLIWSREQDMRHDYYRPAAAVRISAELGADGRPQRLELASACESLDDYSAGATRDPKRGADRTAIGEPLSSYALGPVRYRTHTLDVGVPVGYWRGVAQTQNAFAYESFMDELAHAAGADSFDYRLSLLAPGSREGAVLRALETHWRARAPGRHRGLALVAANGSVVAEIVELSLEQRAIRLHAVHAAIDCGIAVNPRLVEAQVEGGIAYALSAALLGEITLKDGAVEQSNFHDYPLVTIGQMPPVSVTLVASDAPPGGVGEESVGPLAPALANALHAATGERIRRLPLARAGFRLANS
jgi:isoquinoline 1-oxidoreductase subunit beta